MFDGIILLTRFSIFSPEFALLFSPSLSVSQTRSDFEVRHLSTQRLRSEIIRLSSAMLIDEYVFFFFFFLLAKWIGTALISFFAVLILMGGGEEGRVLKLLSGLIS